MNRSERLELLARFCGAREDTLRQFADVFDDPSCWFTGEVASELPLPSPDPERVTLYLARAPAGARLPHHVHDVRETVLVLHGGFVDCATGLHYGPGEALVNEPGSAHSLSVDVASDCVCVIRADFDRPKAHAFDRGMRVSEGGHR